jgi:hypothetical protein
MENRDWPRIYRESATQFDLIRENYDGFGSLGALKGHAEQST